MPLYAYKCQACSQVVELLAKVDVPSPPCPSCGQPTDKQIGKSSFQLKGSGWAKDGYS